MQSESQALMEMARALPMELEWEKANYFRRQLGPRDCWQKERRYRTR
jgi:hypothetical protein